ncbi:ABC transporter substrate-binding protein [Prauserella cavernicola]|uniref:ABC transporter substrate-binding protein n=1 Tax=Prauserella cavernicola TaxID=2800127 RepID=A0A934V1S2_9PSEU|nr:ABC transporter substrate-binding protein [Prauserella cavernicola]MBK1783791.1 ABC transporter substrate-binding protein [Prauserella cavernicola]
MTTTNRRQFLGFTALGLTAAAGVLTGCGTASGRATKTIRYQGWAGQVTPPELAAELGYLGDVTLEWVGNTISGPQDIQSAATGQVDFGGAFNGAVVKLAARQAPITAVIGYYGVDKDEAGGYYVREDSPITDPRDLLGTKVGMNTLGAHSEAMLDIYLERNGLSPAEIEQVQPTVVPPVNIEQSLRQRQIDVAVLGGILREKALERGGIRKLFSDFELLGDFTAGSYVFRDDFLAANGETVRTFVSGVAKAIEWSKSTPHEQVVERFTKIVADRKRNEDTDPLRYWRSYGVAGTGGLINDEELQLWVDWLGKRGELDQGALTVSDIYSNEYNSYAKESRA